MTHFNDPHMVWQCPPRFSPLHASRHSRSSSSSMHGWVGGRVAVDRENSEGNAEQLRLAAWGAHMTASMHASSCTPGEGKQNLETWFTAQAVVAPKQSSQTTCRERDRSLWLIVVLIALEDR